MSMTLASAKIEVARIAGVGGDQNKLALAGSAIRATARAWSNKHNWEFLRKDNSHTRIITACSLANTVVDLSNATPASTAGLNVGQTVTGTGGVNTTITAITSTTTFTVTATAVTNANIDLTFGAYIPVIAGVQHYYAPYDFKDLYGARLLSSLYALKVIRRREVNRKFDYQDSVSYANSIEVAPPGDGTGFVAADQRPRFRISGIPSTSENMLVDYYRAIDGNADPVDMVDDFLDAFLSGAKVRLLKYLNSNDPRLDMLEGLAARELADAISTDNTIDDEEPRMKSQFEVSGIDYDYWMPW